MHLMAVVSLTTFISLLVSMPGINRVIYIFCQKNGGCRTLCAPGIPTSPAAAETGLAQIVVFLLIEEIDLEVDIADGLPGIFSSSRSSSIYLRTL